MRDRKRIRSDGVVALDLFERADAEVMAAGDADPEHRRRFDFPEDFVPTVEHAERVIARWEQERRAEERFPFAVRDASTGELLGGCELLPLGDGVANLSYWTYPPHRRRGVASRAVGLLCDFAREETWCRTVEIVTDGDNVGAQRVAVRNGFTELPPRGGRHLYALDPGGPGPDRPAE